MPIAVGWDNPEHTVIRQTFADTWTWREFYDSCVENMAAMMRDEPHTVHILSDFRTSGPLPFGGAMTQARTVMQHYPTNWGIIVIVSNNRLITALVNAYHNAFIGGFGAKTFSARTVEEAYQIIREHSDVPTN